MAAAMEARPVPAEEARKDRRVDLGPIDSGEEVFVGSEVEKPVCIIVIMVGALCRDIDSPIDILEVKAIVQRMANRLVRMFALRNSVILLFSDVRDVTLKLVQGRRTLETDESINQETVGRARCTGLRRESFENDGKRFFCCCSARTDARACMIEAKLGNDC